MPVMTLMAFIFLSASLLIPWISRTPNLWIALICLSLLAGLVAGNLTLIGLSFIIILLLFWLIYYQRPAIGLFIAIVFLSISFKLKLIPGFYPYFFTSKFAIGLENPLIGIFPLVLLVPLAERIQDWKSVMKGLVFGIAGIFLLAFLAIVSGAIHWNFSLPAYFGIRIYSNLIFTCIPEEAFYRGFVQNTLCGYFKTIKFGKLMSLLITSALFSIAHIFWAPDIGILIFTFLASLLYGSVYLYSKKIESAILCHFLLNLIHMTFFSYHAK